MQQSVLHISDFFAFDIEKFHFSGQPGPRLMVTGGIHGGEVTGTHAARMLIEWLSSREADLKGEVLVLPVCNPPGFRRMQRTSPYDELDMNRIFPGRTDAAPTLAAAAAIYAEATNVDYIVDLHCCGIYGSNYILATYNDSPKAKDLAGMLDIPVVVESGGTPGQLFTEAGRNMDKAAVIIELAGGQPIGKVDLTAANEAFQALLGLLRQLGMVNDQPAVKPEPVFCGKLESVRSISDGYFEPALEAGVWIKAGTVIGTFTSGKESVQQVAPCDCRLMNVGPARYLFKGNQLFVYVVPAV